MLYHRLTNDLRQAVARIAMVALAAAPLIACGETPTERRIRPSAGPLLSVAATPGRPTFFPNTQKYRDGGSKPAKVQVGEVVVQSRALLGRDGRTVVELRAGEFDIGTEVRGEIEKVQVKTESSDGSHGRPLNDNQPGTGGVWSASYAGLARNQTVHTHANVRGDGISGMEVARAANIVKRRPDLATGGISAPPRGLVGVPVEIAAVVRELNRDVGAWANCVLRSDGVRVATGLIWVDAGGDVSCAFMVRFPKTGSQEITVSVEDVGPADDDPRNNSESRSIIIDPRGFSFNAWVSDWTESSPLESRESTTYGPDADGVTTTTGIDISSTLNEFNVQYAQFYGTVEHELPFPVRNLTFSHETNGASVAFGQYDELWPNSPPVDEPWGRQSCASRFQILDNNSGTISLSVCSGVTRNDPDQESGYTGFSIQLYATQVTYYIRVQTEYYRVEHANGEVREGSWTYNIDDRLPRVLATYGPDYTIRLDLTMGGWLYRHHALIPVTHTVVATQPFDFGCRDWSDGLWRGTSCFSRGAGIMRSAQGSFSGTGTVEPAPAP